MTLNNLCKKGTVGALFVLGFLCLFMMFGEPDPTMSNVRWIATIFVLLSISASSFYMMFQLLNKWFKD